MRRTLLTRARSRRAAARPSAPDGESLETILAGVATESGTTLLALARQSPILLIFLRHFGCSFCRQALSDISQLRAELDARGVRPVFVHLGTPERARPYFAYYQLGDAERISDPGALLYRHPLFHLRRMYFLRQLAVPKVWARWLGGTVRRHGIGLIMREDPDQMPGLFYLKDARIARRYRYRTIADTPDYLKLIS